jgi:cell fate regulator YaaT (PSP1 superfamily)
MQHFDAGELELREGDPVIAPTQRGLELGQVAAEPREVAEPGPGAGLRLIKRKATEADLAREEENRERERRACAICAEKIQNHGLPMKLIEARYTFDRARVVFYFAAEGRVDFRRLVRDLAGELKARVELHQVGVRDEAKLFGGFGPCGRPLCCATFLSNLQPVAIKMAKEQNLALNPLKISGVCGRLMCCLSFEYESYKRAKTEMPRVGGEVTIPQGRGRVAEINVIKRTMTVVMEDDTRIEVQAQCACRTAGADAAAPAPEQAPTPTSPPQRKDEGETRPRRRRSRRRPRKPREDSQQG